MPGDCAAGVMVHPLDPKTYAMTIGAYANSAGSGDDYVVRAATIFVMLTVVAMVFNTLWANAGNVAEKTVADERVLRAVNLVLAVIMAAL